MTNADGAGIAPAVNTDARADLAQEADERLSAFLSTDEVGEEQAESGSDDRQAGAAPDPEDPSDGSDRDKPAEADAGISDEATDPLQARIRLADGTEASIEQIQEWREAGLRTADYTRKTQEVAEQRRTLESYAGEVSAQQTAVAEALERALAVVEAYVPSPPSTDLAIRDPARYTQELAIYQAAMNHVEEITRARMDLAAKARETDQAGRARLLHAERERLFAAIPELKDAARRQAFNQDMIRAVEAYGFSEADYAQIVDHRLIRVLADAARYQKIRAASAGGGPKPAAQRAPQPPGRRAGQDTGSGFGTALAQAKRSGTRQDAARAVEAWLGAD
ncbi:hypothetical protein [Phreatobacter sp. AB_2022a]|uniref:hypothetical protein n=1 Tax=Phreatobacter sp. AB_2022a TaxID=3003134 RepID=UPI002286D013|nr:hypothetical protein [Phreatobacter sp. AB_2022a]MCZ0734405.1 hypothetical protein [Phreatobacter sp. AB_2022a]